MPESITQSVGGKLSAFSATFTRPANTTAYAAGDAVSNSATTTVPMLFGPGLARSAGGSGVVVKARLETDKNNDTSQYRLMLYTKSTANFPADNAPDTTLYADRAVFVGYVDFPALSVAAGTNTGSRALWTGGVGSATAPPGPLAFVCDITDNALYGKLVNITGGTPASGQNFWLELTVLQN